MLQFFSNLAWHTSYLSSYRLGKSNRNAAGDNLNSFCLDWRSVCLLGTCLHTQTIVGPKLQIKKIKKTKRVAGATSLPCALRFRFRFWLSLSLSLSYALLVSCVFYALSCAPTVKNFMTSTPLESFSFCISIEAAAF